MRNNNLSRIWLLMAGLGSFTKVYLGGAIAFTELALFVIAPFLFVRHFREYKRDGFLIALILPWLMIIGCFASCKVNGAPMFAFVKCAMMFYSIFAGVAVFYIILRRNFDSIGWFLMGALLSQIISIFYFNPQVVTDGTTSELLSQMDVEQQMQGVLFWYPKINRLLYLPIQIAYFQMPSCYSCVAPILAAIGSITISVSGRGAAAMALVSATLIGYCRKSRRRMRAIGRHFITFSVAMIFVAIGIKSLYSYAARNGLLGPEAQGKYEVQTRGDNSFMRILIGGRTEFFITLRALLDSPIFGIGPYAEDKNGYTQEFLAKYGTQEDYDYYVLRLMLARVHGERERLPQHSTLTQFWGNAGIVGLFLCLYYLYLVFKYFNKYAGSIPHWFGYLAIATPPSIFTLFFNPYSDRVGFPLLLTCLLLSRAVGNGKLRLPLDIEMEARRYE